MRRKFAPLAVAAVSLLTMGIASRAEAANPVAALARPMRVSEALEALGNRADGVARSHRSSAAQWKALAADDAVWVDATGALFYVDPASAPQAAPVVAAAAPFPYTQTFLLHSNPTATRKVYLDFNGHAVSGTAWNTSYTSGAAFTAEPYSIDADTTTFTNVELDEIQAAWQRIAEDYAVFDVDVTTEDPGAAGINRATTTDTAFGSRLVITTTNTIYSSCGCGGIAYVGSIDVTGSTHDLYQPAFVFTRGVGTSGKSVAEAGSHEVGHNLGLNHDGTASLGYYAGHAAWAPIMGVGYYNPVSQWSRGEYAGANNTQDDFAVAGTHAIPLRADDFGSVAAPSAAGTSPVTRSGVIHNRTDQDAFQFTAAAGTVSFTATPAAVGANLDIRLDLLNSAGTVVATNNPAVAKVDANSATGLGASVSAVVPAGTYRIVVDGVGFGDPLTTGYTDYGSSGQYTLSGTYPTSGANQPPVAAATATPSSGVAPLTVAFSSAGSSDADGTIASYSWVFGDGTTSTVANPSKVYSSAGTFNATLTVTDNLGATASASAVVTVTAAPTTTTLTSGVTVSNIAGAQGSSRYYVINVAAGADSLTVRTSGGTGDVDLYVRSGSLPTLTSYSCRPYLSGNAETCTFNNPAAGSYYVMLQGDLAYSGVALVATVVTTPALTNNVAVTNISGAAGSMRYWRIVVPAGRPSLTVTTSGGTGDADLYVRLGSRPTTSTYNCVSNSSTNADTCTIANPAAGTWYILVRGFAAYSGLTLRAVY